MQQYGSIDTTQTILYNEDNDSILLQSYHAPRLDSTGRHTRTILFTGAATVPPKSPVPTN